MPSSVSTVSSALVAIEPTAIALTRIFGARSAAMSRVMCVSAAFAVPYATKPRSRSRPIAEEMLTIAPLALLEHVRHRGLAQHERGGGVEVEGALEVAGAGVEERPGDGAAGVVHDDVEPAELVDGTAHERDHRVVLDHVGGDHERRAAEVPDLPGHDLELLGGPGREQDVGTRLGQRERRGGADAAARAGDDRDLAVHPESFEHPLPPLFAGSGP